MKGNYYLKVTFTAILIIILFAVIINVVVWGWKWFKSDANYWMNNPPFTCEIKYKDIYYKGFCDDETKNSFKEIIGYDIETTKNVEILNICLSNPYAYRYEACDNLMEVN